MGIQRPGGIDVTKRNPNNVLYTKGSRLVDGSRRHSIDPDTGIEFLQTCIDGLWQPASLKLGPNSLWLGNIGLAEVGHHLVTEALDGHLHFHAHSEFDGHLGIVDAKIINPYVYTPRVIFQPDDSGEFTGLEFAFTFPAPSHMIVLTGYWKTGATAATAPVRFQIWKGVDDTGVRIFDQTYPDNEFPSNTEILLTADGYLEFDAGEYYHLKFESTEIFSMKTDTTKTYLWFGGNVSLAREDSLLQTAPYVDGENYNEGQYLIHNREIYICNTPGPQTGTWEDNADKWDDFQQYADYKSVLAKSAATTGLTEGGEITQTGAALLSWTAGKGYHTDFTDPTNPIVTRVLWDIVVDYTPANLGTPGQYILAYDKAGAVVEFPVPDISARKIRDLIIFGGYSTIGGIVALISTSATNIGYDGFFAFKDFMRDVIGPANVKGNTISASGGNLKLDNDGGTIFIIGSNFRNDKEITDERPVPHGSGVYFSRVLRVPAPSTQVTTDIPGLLDVVDPTKYDDGSGVLQTVASNDYSVQVVYLTPDGHYVVAFGQQVFNKEEDAEEAIYTGTLIFEERPLLERFVRRAFIVIRGGETDLANAVFIEEGKFRIGGVTSGGGVKIHSSLQKLEWSVSGHLFENGGEMNIGDYDLKVGGVTVLQDNLISKLSDGVYIGRSRIASTPWRQDDSTGWQTWTAQSINPGTEKRWRSCDMSGDGKYQVAVGNEGQKVWVSADYGQTWNAYGDTKNYMCVACSADGKYMTVGVIYGNICISDDYGVTWTQTSSPTPAWKSIAMDATGQHQVGTVGGDGSEGDIYLSDDYGVTWVAQGLTSYHRDSVAMSSDGKYIMCTEGQTQEILKSEDYGETWATTGPGTGRNWEDIAMSSDGKHVIISAGGEATGAVRISNDYGNSWKAATGCPNSYWFGVGMSGSGKYMVAGAYTLDEIYMSDDFGDNFSPVSGTNGEWDDFAMSQDGMIRLAAADGDDLYTAHGGGAIILGNVTMSGELRAPTKIYFAGSGNNYIEWNDVDDVFHFTAGIDAISQPIWCGELNAGMITCADIDCTDALETPVLKHTDSGLITVQNDLDVDGILDAVAVKVGGVDVLTNETDPVFVAWDKSTGISITESQISDLQSYLITENDPIFTAWDKSSGISITEAQISDLQSYLLSESDPVFTAWDKSDGIEIFGSQLKGFEDAAIPFESGFGGLSYDSLFNWDNVNKRLAVNKINATSTVDVDGTIKATDFKVGGTSVSLNGHTHAIADLTGDGPLQFQSATGQKINLYSDTYALGVQQGELRIASNQAIAFYTGGYSGNERMTLSETGTLDVPYRVNTPILRNSSGLLKIQPNVDGDVELFGDTDVANNENSKILKVWRRASEGNDYIRFYISNTRNCYIHSSNKLTLQSQNPFTINSVTDDIIFKVGDNAGSRKVYFRDSDGTTVASIDSNGNLTCNEIETINSSKFGGDVVADRDVDIANSLTVGNDVVVVDDVMIYGDVFARNHVVDRAIVFHDKSTQTEAGERHSSQGHVHTAIYSGAWYDTDPESIAIRDMHFSPDGLTMYIIGLASNGAGDCSIWEYPLTVPWDLSTVGVPTIKSIEAYGNTQAGIFISIDGRRLWTVCTTNDTVIEYSMTPWTISTLTWVQAKDVSVHDSAPTAVHWSPAGDKLFITGDGDNDVVSFSVSTEWDISTISWFEDFGTNIDAPTGLDFSSDGRRMYVMDGSAEDDIHEFHLTIPWLISSARLVNLFDVSAENGSPQGIFCTADSSRIFMAGTSTPDGIYSYNMGMEVGGAIISNNGPVQGGSMTTTQRDALVAVNGMFIYNTTTNAFNFRENGSWVTK